MKHTSAAEHERVDARVRFFSEGAGAGFVPCQGMPLCSRQRGAAEGCGFWPQTCIHVWSLWQSRRGVDEHCSSQRQATAHKITHSAV